MKDIEKAIGGFIAFLFAVYFLSELAKVLPTKISGLELGPLIVGVFIVYAIVWFLKEVLEK